MCTVLSCNVKCTVLHCNVYLGVQHQELGDKILSMGRDMFKVGQIHCVITAESFGHRSVSAMSLVER